MTALGLAIVCACVCGALTARISTDMTHDLHCVCRPPAPVTIKPNPEEVDAVKYVDLTELRAMMDPASGLHWSPWFRIIAKRFLEGWWADLAAAADPSSKAHQDLTGIHRIDEC